VGARPTRRPLQPEETGAAKEVTNWLKHSECVSRIGDSASVQAATKVNAGQISKRTMRRPTRHLPVINHGELLGIVSIGDLVKSIIGDREFVIEQLEHYIRGAKT
jgi:CBS domain-containing protein